MSMFPRQALRYDISFKLSHGNDYITCITKQYHLLHTAGLRTLYSNFLAGLTWILLITNATIIVDNKYEECLPDIRKKDILGTYRIKKGFKKIDLAKNRTSVV